MKQDKWEVRLRRSKLNITGVDRAGGMNQPNIEHCPKCPNILKSMVKFGQQQQTLCPMVAGGEKSPCHYPKKDSVEILSKTGHRVGGVNVSFTVGRIK